MNKAKSVKLSHQPNTNDETTQTESDEHLSLNDKIARLDQQVEWFYGDDFTLDAAVEKYKSAVALAKDIEHDLNNLKNEISLIDKDFSIE